MPAAALVVVVAVALAVAAAVGSCRSDPRMRSQGIGTAAGAWLPAPPHLAVGARV